jgi:hypothetical protein
VRIARGISGKNKSFRDHGWATVTKDTQSGEVSRRTTGAASPAGPPSHGVGRALVLQAAEDHGEKDFSATYLTSAPKT